MTDFRAETDNFGLTPVGLADGVWEGRMERAGQGDPPDLSVTHLGIPVEGVTVDAADDRWRIRVPIPPAAVSDGVQTVLIAEAAGCAVLGRVVLVAGEVLAGDLRAEVDLLRAELDLLKRAFRSHCARQEG